MLEMCSQPSGCPLLPTPHPPVLSSLSAGVAGRGWLHGVSESTGGRTVFTGFLTSP